MKRKKASPKKKPVAKKPVDPFVEFDQAKHALALKEIAVQRALLEVYRYALTMDDVAHKNSDRLLAKEMRKAADEELNEMDDGECDRSCCRSHSRAEIRSVIQACDVVLDATEMVL